MKRIYFLLPGLAIAKQIVDELLRQGVPEKHIHIIANQDLALEAIPEAGLLQKSDFIPAVERGVAIGGASGVIAGLIGLSIPGFGAVLGGGALLATALAGAGIGSLLGSMVSLDVPNTRHKAFQEAIEEGQILMLVDVPDDQVDFVSTTVLRYHPEATLENVEPRVQLIPPGY
ncbi:MAG: DUF1269 domain-containing protein [Porticoccaceae bacterium]